MGLIIIPDADFVHELANRFASLLNLLFIEQDSFIVGKQLSQQLDCLTVIPALDQLYLGEIVFSDQHILEPSNFLLNMVFYY